MLNLVCLSHPSNLRYLGVVTLEAASYLDVELIDGHDVGQLRHLLQRLVLRDSVKQLRVVMCEDQMGIAQLAAVAAPQVRIPVSCQYCT